MLGRSAPPKMTYVRPVGGPENTSNNGKNPNINNLAWPPRPSPYPPRRIFCPKMIYGTSSSPTMSSFTPIIGPFSTANLGPSLANIPLLFRKALRAELRGQPEVGGVVRVGARRDVSGGASTVMHIISDSESLEPHFRRTKLTQNLCFWVTKYLSKMPRDIPGVRTLGRGGGLICRSNHATFPPSFPPWIACKYAKTISQRSFCSACLDKKFRWNLSRRWGDKVTRFVGISALIFWCLISRNSGPSERGCSKCGRSQKQHVNERKRGQTQVCERARKGANERKRALPRKTCKQPVAWNNQVWELPRIQG